MAFKKLLLFICLVISILLAAHPTWAQLSRQERRELKRELRKISPEQLDQMKVDQENMQQKITDLSRKTSQLQEEIQDKEKQISSLKSDLAQQEKKLKERTQEVIALREKEDQWDKGLVFRVQLGAFSDYDYQEALGSSPQLRYEENSDWQKYIMGNFRSYDEADELKKHLRRTGIRDAWIVPYRDGERVPLKEVLDQVLEERVSRNK